MSKLLLNEEPLVISRELAVKVGLNESIVLQQVHYWLKQNEKTKRNYRNGYFWTYNSYSEWQKQFPFWSESTIKRIITRLEKEGYLITGTFNKLKIDRTKWYRINYERLESAVNSPLCQNDLMVGSICSDASGQYDLTNTKDYPETTSETSIDKGNFKKISMNFLDFVKSNQEYFADKDETISVVEYYLAKYNDHLRKGHPNLKAHQWEMVVENIMRVDTDRCSYELSIDEIRAIIDQHFLTAYKNCDWNIIHFVSGDVMKNRFYEAVY